MIKLLPEDLINKIAAGEVVERPVSVVKELTENSIDAGATKIHISIEAAGTKLIQVTDNGRGMNEEDARLCLLRHATSKISSIEDLFSLRTLGFRGEALASIAAISQFTLITKPFGNLEGYRVTLGEYQKPEVHPAAAEPGTTVMVENLFYNVPARRKFLKLEATEFQHILRYLQQFCIIHPDIEITLEHNKQIIFSSQKNSLEERIQDLLGISFFESILPIEDMFPEGRIIGYIAKPIFVHASHKNQYLFVNRRPIYDYLISRSLLEAYETLIPKGYFPAYILSLELDPKTVDFNVHPRKAEVKFLHHSSVMDSIKKAAKKTLKKHNLIVDHRLFSGAKSPSFYTYEPHLKPELSNSSSRESVVSLPFHFSHGIQAIRNPFEKRLWNIIGQIHNSFILVESPEGLQVFDQHAVSEIVNYSKLYKQYQQGAILSQQLLIPLAIHLSPEEKVLLEENRHIFEKLGWEITELSHQTFQVHIIPQVLRNEKIEINVHEILTSLKEEKILDIHSKELEILKYQACRGAVMFGDILSINEIKSLLSEWLEVENNTACEHGRPAVARITVDEMKKFFKR